MKYLNICPGTKRYAQTQIYELRRAAIDRTRLMIQSLRRYECSRIVRVINKSISQDTNSGARAPNDRALNTSSCIHARGEKGKGIS